MKLTSALLKEAYFFGLVFILLVAVILVFAPFLSVVVAAFILVEFFMPLYRKLREPLTPWVASITVTIISVVVC